MNQIRTDTLVGLMPLTCARSSLLASPSGRLEDEEVERGRDQDDEAESHELDARDPDAEDREVRRPADLEEVVLEPECQPQRVPDQEGQAY
jgi:hypothetical protein